MSTLTGLKCTIVLLECFEKRSTKITSTKRSIDLNEHGSRSNVRGFLSSQERKAKSMNSRFVLFVLFLTYIERIKNIFFKEF
ncbi:hypothetical protein AX774_g754 [Zancudomyces culisetae]|uniref:Uncharacterized protein n=1 Tax=Zancudomyces culisetae TaxID=1213189 RepID=A0A1R1PXN0_ZANCU|nr:hypothetical protein AX774_g754 [Zancudomyces culisetae]|eukprot:OMH85692.1 hypothetical protein AX774_g754 [Zancudomyces culisetae]